MMLGRRNKLINNSMIFESEHNISPELKEENGFFDGWKDESCGNYVGWLKTVSSCNIIVSRMYAGKVGVYSLTKVKHEINSASDPFGKNPEWYSDKVYNLTLEDINKILKDIE